MIVEKSISLVEEKRIIIGLIISTKFIQDIYPVIDLNYFLNPYLKTVAIWCISFYEIQKKAPYKHIQDIYEAESIKLKDTEAELIKELLSSLSSQYDENSINNGYLESVTVDYFRKRELEITANNISVFTEKDDYESAEEEMKKYKQVSLDMNSRYLIDFNDIKQVEEIYDEREKEDKNFFKLPGELGNYIGTSKRGDVVGYFAKAKLGKSWTLVENFKQSIMQKRRTIFWSLEMTRTEILPRILKSFNPMVDESGYYFYPVFDCVHNQDGTCIDRESPVTVIQNGILVPDDAHIPCTKCMRGRGNMTHPFDVTVYHLSIFRKKDDIFSVDDFLLGKKNSRNSRQSNNLNMFHKYGRLYVHPKYTLTYDQLRMDIDQQISTQNFIPDIFIIDYVDILEIASRYDNYKAVDEAWKLMAKIAGEYNVLVITATQANKEGHDVSVLTSQNQGGYYGKNQHVNLMVGINQTSKEKEDGIVRYGITEARSQFYIPGKTCMVLQDIPSGQAYLDSYYNN